MPKLDFIFVNKCANKWCHLGLDLSTLGNVKSQPKAIFGATEGTGMVEEFLNFSQSFCKRYNVRALSEQVCSLQWTNECLRGLRQ